MNTPLVDDLTLARRAEWKTSWTLVLASTIGFALYSVLVNSIGLFIQPLSNEFGWTRTKILFGMTLLSTFAVFLSPLVGGLIDRFGARRIALPGLILTGLSLASFGLTTGSTIEWTLLWVFHAFVVLLIKTTVWTTAVSSIFDASRSLAIAITISGTALAQAIVPPLAQWLIADFGWRMAFISLGLGFGALAFVLSYCFLYDRHDFKKSAAKKVDDNDEQTEAQPTEELAGLSLQEAIRSPHLIRIAIATLLTMVMGVGIMVNQVPILIDAGFSRENAAYCASLFGIAGIVGKLVTGWLMDHYEANLVGGLTIGAAAFAFILLLKDLNSPFLMASGLVIVGYAAGTKLQLCAYLTSRYAGLRNYGKIFGVMASLVALGGGTGPILAGWIYDTTGTYASFIYTSVVFYLIAAVMLYTLGPKSAVPKLQCA